MRRTIVSGLAALFLLVQGGLPLMVLTRAPPRSTDLSWDMFSHALSCSKFDAIARVPGGPWGSVRLDLDFGNWAQLSRALVVPSRLDAYSSFLCAKLRDEERQPVELRFVAECRDDRTGPPISLADAERDYCSAREVSR